MKKALALALGGTLLLGCPEERVTVSQPYQQASSSVHSLSAEAKLVAMYGAKERMGLDPALIGAWRSVSMSKDRGQTWTDAMPGGEVILIARITSLKFVQGDPVSLSRVYVVEHYDEGTRTNATGNVLILENGMALSLLQPDGQVGVLLQLHDRHGDEVGRWIIEVVR